MSTQTSVPDSAAPPVPDHVPWQRQAWAFAERHLRALLRSPIALFLAVGWPLAWYGLTVALFLPADTTAVTLGSVAVSFAFFGAFTVVVAVFAGAFAGDLAGGRYRKFRSLPIAPSADLAGRFLAALVLAIGSHVTVLAVAFVTGARFEPRLAAVTIVPLTVLSFCVVALAVSLALGAVLSKPEYMTTIGIVLALIAFYLTGFNGTQPGLVADDAWFVNVLPNSLATRMQLYALFAGDFADSGVIPPELPSGIEYVGLSVAYAVGLFAASIALVRRVAYGGESL